VSLCYGPARIDRLVWLDIAVALAVAVNVERPCRPALPLWRHSLMTLWVPCMDSPSEAR
jgi:hypothetical protein